MQRVPLVSHLGYKFTDNVLQYSMLLFRIREILPLIILQLFFSSTFINGKYILPAAVNISLCLRATPIYNRFLKTLTDKIVFGGPQKNQTIKLGHLEYPPWYPLSLSHKLEAYRHHLSHARLL